MLPDFKSYHKAMTIKTVWYGTKQTHTSMEQNKNPKNEPTLTRAISLWKGGKNIKWSKRQLFQ